MNKIKNKKMALYLNLGSLVLALVVNILIVIILFGIARYMELSGIVILLAIAMGIIICLLVDFLVFYSARFRDHLVQYITIGFSVILVITGIYGVATVNKLNNAVDEVIDNHGEIQYEEMVVSFVTYNNTKVTDLKGVSGKKIGYFESTEENSVSSLGQKKLEKENISVQYEAYDSYNDLLLGLIDGEVEAAIMSGSYYETFSSNDGYLEYLEKTNTIYSFTEKVEMGANASANLDIVQKPFTILLIGYAGGNDLLSDSLILVTVNPQTLMATMTSVARDSFVPIACYSGNRKDKLTHARQVSRQCTMGTLENLLDVNVDFYVEINFEGVVEIVDALDGIWIESPVEFVGQNSSIDRGEYTVWVGKGGQWVNGEQALTFSRERYHMPNGDLDRQLNQQQVIRQILDRIMQLKDVNKALNVLSAASGNVKTNLSTSQMVQLLQHMLDATSNKRLTPMQQLTINTSRVTGYSSWSYNEQAQLPLWVYPLWKGSVADNEKLINDTLGEFDGIDQRYAFSFDILQPYFPPELYQLVYNEIQEHEAIPDFMPQMAGSKAEVWTLEQAQAWASQRGITLNVVEVRQGDSGYSSGYAHNTIISQSVKYGVRTSNFSTLTISVVKHQLNCADAGNHIYDDCKDIVLNFVGMTVSEFNSWASSAGISGKVQIVLIPSTDPSYDASKIGYITKQDQPAYSKLNLYDRITVYTMSYPLVTIPNMSSWTRSQVETWANQNLTSASNVEYREEHHNTIQAGMVISVAPSESGVTTSNFKSNNKLIVKISKGQEPSVTVSSYVGQPLINLQNFASSQGIIVNVSYQDTPTTDPNLDGQLGNLVSHDTGSVKVSAGINAVVIRYVYVAPTEPTPDGGSNESNQAP